MFHRFHQRFGTAGLLIAVIALIAALGGTALAASGALTSKQKKEVKAIAKSFQGTGPAGAQGNPGAPGAAGKEGSQGKQGEPGKEGKEGKEGSPWTAGGTLPKGKALKGVWDANGTATAAGQGASASISFNIPLAAAPNEHYIKVGATLPSGCTGSVAEPGAEEGNLCVFAKQETNIGSTFVANWETGAIGSALVSPLGGGLLMVTAGAGAYLSSGTWAVTAG
jgi:hypothetical protein